MERYFGYGNRIIRARLANNPRFCSEIDSLWAKAQQEIHGHQTGKTEQGTLHCLRVEDNIGMILGDHIKKFKDEDLFVLSAASALHDVGKIERYEYKESNHGRLGARLLRRPRIADQFFTDERLAEAVAYVISSHDNGALQDIPEDEFLIGTCPLLLRELASIFRLADMLDTDYRRVSSIVMEIGARKFIENEALWLARSAIKGWKTQKDKIVFQAIPKNSRESTAVLTCITLLIESMSEDQTRYLRGARVIYFNTETNRLEEAVVRIPHHIVIDPKDLARFPKARDVKVQRAKLFVEVSQLETWTDVGKDAIVVLRIYNSGQGEATNVEIQGWEHTPEIQLISSRRICNIPPYSRVEWPLRIRASKKGKFLIENLVLVYEEADRAKDPEVQIPRFAIHAIVKKPQLKLDIAAPRTVSSNDVFVIKLRVQNIGDGAARDVHIEMPIDQKLVVSGFTEPYLSELPEKTSEEFSMVLKAPDQDKLRISGLVVQCKDKEGKLIRFEQPPMDIPIKKIKRGEERLHALFAGQEIADQRYSVIRKIGAGGYGDVYLVRDRIVERLVALKLIDPRLMKDATTMKQLIQDTNKASGIHDPNIVTVDSLGFLSYEGVRYPYIVMEFVEGETLEAILQTGKMDLLSICCVMADMSKALHHLHSHKVVHGDVKPSNILHDTTHNLWKLTDFYMGLSLATSLRGTPLYCSPEAAKALVITEKSDIYSLGVVLREMLTGHPKGDLSNIKKELLDTNVYFAKILGDVAKKMTNENPSQRPMAMEVYSKASQTWPVL